jgi:hypothetical protein
MDSGAAGKAFLYKPLGFNLGFLAQPSAATPSAVPATPEASAAAAGSAAGPPTNALQLLASTPLGKSLLSSILPANLASARASQVGEAPCQVLPGYLIRGDAWRASQVTAYV